MRDILKRSQEIKIIISWNSFHLLFRGQSFLTQDIAEVVKTFLKKFASPQKFTENFTPTPKDNIKSLKSKENRNSHNLDTQ